MNIADFTKQEVHAIVDEWVEFARTTVPAAQEFSREDLADHAKVLLLAIAADITDSQGAQARHDKSHGNRPRLRLRSHASPATTQRNASSKASPSINS